MARDSILREASPAVSQSPRTVEVHPPGVRRETMLVLRIGFQVLFGWALLLTAERGLAARPGTKAASARLAPGEMAFADLPSADQRIFRAIQEGMTEAERLRSSTGRWPTPAELAAQGIPPFAPDPIDRDGYTWSMRQKDLEFNYVGSPAPGRERPRFVVLIVEPSPGMPDDPQAPTDEIHHRLANGMMLHVTILMKPPGRSLTQPGTWLNGEPGWTQITTGVVGP
jgi:hypothetical protein